MPYKDPAKKRKAQREWIARRRAEWLEGKSCVDCGSTENLELDHVDPAEKIHHAIWSWSKVRRDAEIAKCVPRCAECHHERHASERRSHGHGGYTRGCRCEVCKAAKRRGRESNARKRLCRPLPNHSATSPEQASYSQLELGEAA